MALLDSLMSAIVRADGDALVMHVGERPYVVVGTQTITISTHGLNLDAMTGMLAQLLAPEAHTQLEEFGAVEYKVPQQGEDRFSVVAARGGDDIWIEIRRRRPQPAPVAAPPEPVQAPAAVAEPAPAPIAEAPSAPEPIAEPVAEPVPEPAAEPAPQPIAEPIPEPVAAMPEPAVEAPALAAPILAPVAESIDEPIAQPAPELIPEPIPEPVAEAAAEPVSETPAEPVPEPIAETVVAPVAEPAAESIAAFVPEPIPEPVPEPVAESISQPIDDEPVVHEIAAALAAPEPVASPIASDAELQQQILEDAPKIAALSETIEGAARVAEILEQAPKIAALAETLEVARVEEVLEQAPKIAALAETLESAPAITSVQEGQRVQEAQRVQEVQRAQEVQAVHQVQAVHSTPEVRAAQTSHAGGGKPPAPVTPAAPVERNEPRAPLEPVQPVEPREPVRPLEPAPPAAPLTRTVRIEVPPRTQHPSRATGASTVDRLLRVAAARNASALFLTSDSKPWIRVDGDLRFLDSESQWSRADVESAILEIAPESEQPSIGRGDASEWIAEFEGVGRIRCTTFHDHRGPGVQLRMIATKAATAEQLGLSPEVQALATETQGLVLVTGPRASGKTTMLSALIDLVNSQRADYVISLERQVRLLHDNRQALVSQRELRGGADDAAAAARAALRESPDVLVIDDLISAPLLPLLLTAASEGVLVFVSIAAASTAEAVEKFVELAPAETRQAVRAAMADAFRGVVGQVLLKKTGGRLAAAREVLLATAPVVRAIEEGQIGQLAAAVDGGAKHGMVSLTDSLAGLVRAGAVDLREAFRKAPDRTRMLELLKRNGVDTTAVERLA